MNISLSIRWNPAPPLTPGHRTRPKGPLKRKLNLIMLAMANDAHNLGGNPTWKVSNRVKRYGGITGTKTGRLRRGWRPVAGEAHIINAVPYSRDFYYGHPRRLVYVPAHTRKTRKGKVKVRGHYKMEPPQAARPINWTRPWILKATDAVKEFYEMR